MMKKYLLVCITILLVSFTSAEIQSLPTQKLNNCITIPQTHANVTSVNVTKIKYPNSTEDYTIRVMNTSNNYNYNYTFCGTDTIGNYIVTTCGNGDGVITCLDFDFEVTYTGEKVSLSNAVAPLIMVILSFIFLAIGWNFNDEHWMLKTFFYFLSVGMGIISMNSIRIIASESLNLSKMTSVGLTIMVIALSLFFIYMFVYAFLESVRVFKEKRGVRWEFD